MHLSSMAWITNGQHGLEAVGRSVDQRYGHRAECHTAAVFGGKKGDRNEEERRAGTRKAQRERRTKRIMSTQKRSLFPM